MSPSAGGAAAEPFDGFYGGRRVLLTGHTGFKGSWLCVWLGRLGALVGGYALAPPTDPNLFELIGVGGEVAHVAGDVRDLAALSRAVASFAPEIVFHLAAQPLVRPSYDDPRGTFETNVMGTVNLLEAVRACPSVRAVVVVTSDKCYENRETVRPYTEDDALGGRDPYSASKGCAELAAAAYRRSFFGPEAAACIASARAGNVIGGGDWAADRLVPDCVRAVAAGDVVAVRHADAVRPWQHVLESLSGYLWLGARLVLDGGVCEGAWNFGPDPDAGVPVSEVVETFMAAYGAGAWRAIDGRAAQVPEAGLLLLDCAKAREQLGWRAVWDVRTAIARTAAWYRAWASGSDEAELRRALLADIGAYVEGARDLGLSWARARREAANTASGAVTPAGGDLS